MKKFSLKKLGISFVSLILLSVVFKILPFGSNPDPKLKADLIMQLSAKEQRLALINDPDGTCPKHPCMKDVVEENLVKIISYSVSHSILSLSDDRYVIKVVYKDVLGKEQEEYHAYDWNPIGGWLHKYQSSWVGYYLNFF